MRRVLPLLLSVLALTASVASGHGPYTARIPLEIGDREDGPVSILEQKTRVGNTLDKDPWASVRGSAASAPARAYGSGESQLVFNVGFRNASDRELAAVSVLWEGLDGAGRPCWERVDIHSRDSVAPGEVRTIHVVEVDPGREIARYRVSVLRVDYADGAVWWNESLVRERENIQP